MTAKITLTRAQRTHGRALAAQQDVNQRQVWRDGELIGSLYGIATRAGSHDRPTRFLFVHVTTGEETVYTRLADARIDLDRRLGRPANLGISVEEADAAWNKGYEDGKAGKIPTSRYRTGTLRDEYERGWERGLDDIPDLEIWLDDDGRPNAQSKR